MRALRINRSYLPSIMGIGYDHSASTYYRLTVPLRALFNVYRARVSWAFIEDDQVLQAHRYDMVILSRVSSLALDRAKLAIQLLHAQGTRVFLDYDDDLLSVPEWNPGRLSIEAQDSIRALMGLADGVIVTNPTLASAFRPYARRIAILPNFVESEAWPDTRKPNAKIRIGLYGSASHVRDWELVATPMRQIMERYGDQVEFSVSEPVPDYLKDIPHTAQPWVPLSSYPYVMNQVDIGLCPLIDDDFNRSKTALKALEYGLAGAAVVASPTLYRDVVQGRGALARSEAEWYDAIERYITAAHQRQLASRLLGTYVRERYSATVRAQTIMRTYQDLYLATMDAQGPTFHVPVA
jgi:hypothetical protein